MKRSTLFQLPFIIMGKEALNPTACQSILIHYSQKTIGISWEVIAKSVVVALYWRYLCLENYLNPMRYDDGRRPFTP